MIIIRPATIDDAALVSSSIPENDHTAWSVGTTYALGARVRVVAANVHKVYESLQASNVGHDPGTSPTWWLEVGPTNRWSMFDRSITSQSTQANSISVTIQPTGRVDSLALLNISAASVHIVMTDTIDGVVYDKTFGLNSTSGINDWFAYFFEPIVRKKDFVALDMPPYNNPTIQVTVTDTGNTAAIGALVAGFKKKVGGTQYGAKTGIQDYSVKKRDDFGNYTVLERAFSKHATFTLLIDNSFVDEAQNMLSAYRATPIVYIGSDKFNSTMIYGFYKDFAITIPYPTKSICSIEIEGLT